MTVTFSTLSALSTARRSGAVALTRAWNRFEQVDVDPPAPDLAAELVNAIHSGDVDGPN